MIGSFSSIINQINKLDNGSNTGGKLVEKFPTAKGVFGCKYAYPDLKHFRNVVFAPLVFTNPGRTTTESGSMDRTTTKH